MGRKPKNQDATGKLRPGDEVQTTPKGTRIGLLPKAEVMAAFRKIARSKKQ